MSGRLRVIDFGDQPPLRSQTLWHAVAAGVSRGAPPTLSFVRSSGPYVSIGYHRSLAEVRTALPVFRRRIGGGPVYVDSGQLLFQVTVPARPGLIGAAAMRRLLAPAVAAFNDTGIPAVLDSHGEVSVGEAKISGTGGGQLGGAAVAVGNLIQRFDHRAAAGILAVAPDVRREAERLMRRFVRATPACPEAFKRALVGRVAEALGLSPFPGDLGEEELVAAEELEAALGGGGPVAGGPAPGRVKIRSGVWVFEAAGGGSRVVGSVVFGVLERVEVQDLCLDGAAASVARALAGRRLEEAVAVAEGLGEAGRRVAGALRGADWRSP